jgi:hypothetical protein
MNLIICRTLLIQIQLRNKLITMPIDYSKYPPNWKTEIRPDTLKRAKYCCEQCGVRNYSVGYNQKNGRFIGTGGTALHDLAGEGLSYPSLEPITYKAAAELRNHLNEVKNEHKHIVIVLTVAHLDHNITNNCPTNLKAFCQKCHLSYDAVHHKKNARQTIMNKKGLLELEFGND